MWLNALCSPFSVSVKLEAAYSGFPRFHFFVVFSSCPPYCSFLFSFPPTFLRFSPMIFLTVFLSSFLLFCFSPEIAPFLSLPLVSTSLSLSLFLSTSILKRKLFSVANTIIPLSLSPFFWRLFPSFFFCFTSSIFMIIPHPPIFTPSSFFSLLLFLSYRSIRTPVSYTVNGLGARASFRQLQQKQRVPLALHSVLRTRQPSFPLSPRWAPRISTWKPIELIQKKTHSRCLQYLSTLSVLAGSLKGSAPAST